MNGIRRISPGAVFLLSEKLVVRPIAAPVKEEEDKLNNESLLSFGGGDEKDKRVILRSEITTLKNSKYWMTKGVTKRYTLRALANSSSLDVRQFKQRVTSDEFPV